MSTNTRSHSASLRPITATIPLKMTLLREEQGNRDRHSERSGLHHTMSEQRKRPDTQLEDRFPVVRRMRHCLNSWGPRHNHNPHNRYHRPDRHPNHWRKRSPAKAVAVLRYCHLRL